mmetsp:Transcript_7008/g.28872  ORF Transcript_7008/g.28872 Transcript_7008/m.28872 type:complete len:458 (-) Transcript_7008:560-1933(-)
MALVLLSLSGGSKTTSPCFKHPNGSVTTHALPSNVSPDFVTIVTPPSSPSPSTLRISVTTTFVLTSSPFESASVTPPYPPLSITCFPPNPPYASSWFQCAMEILDKGAEHPYSRLAQCHPSKRRSEKDKVSFRSSSASSMGFSVEFSVFSAFSSSASFFASPYRSRSSAAITSSSETSASASAPSRSTRSRAWSMSTSRAFSARASASPETFSPVFPSKRGKSSRNACVSNRNCRAVAKLGSARTPSQGLAVRRRGSAAVPVTMDAPKSIGTERGFSFVFGAHVNTRPPTRSRASSTITSWPSARTARAAARPAGPAPTTITGFVGRGLAPFAASDAAFANAEAASLASVPLVFLTCAYDSGSLRNLVTTERITSLRSLRSHPRSASTAARIWRSVVLFMSAPRRKTTVRSMISSSETSAEPGAFFFSASDPTFAAAAARAVFTSSPARKSLPPGHP